MEWWTGGRAPYRFPVAFDQKTREYNWQVDLPVGGPYLVSMHDGNGATGGVSKVRISFSCRGLFFSWCLCFLRLLLPKKEGPKQIFYGKILPMFGAQGTSSPLLPVNSIQSLYLESLSRFLHS